MIPNSRNYLEKEYYIPKKGISGLRQTVQPFFFIKKLVLLSKDKERAATRHF